MLVFLCGLDLVHGESTNVSFSLTVSHNPLPLRGLCLAFLAMVRLSPQATYIFRCNSGPRWNDCVYICIFCWNTYHILETKLIWFSSGILKLIPEVKIYNQSPSYKLWRNLLVDELVKIISASKHDGTFYFRKI